MARRSAISVAMAAAIVAGCAGGPSATPSAVPATSTPAAPTVEPTIGPPVSPIPSDDVDCPSDPPTTVTSVDDLADPSCYGTTELAIDGWLSEIDLHLGEGERDPSWTTALAGLFARSATVDDSIFDFLLADRRGPFVAVVAQPETAIDLSGLGRWVTLRGHFNDPEASACSVLNWEPDPDDASQEPPDLACERLFVATSLAPLHREAPDCPTESPMTLATYMAADIGCFMGHEVELSGWEDRGEGFGGTGDIYPISTGSLRLATEAQLVDRRWESGEVEELIFPWTVRGSGVRLDRDDRRVVVTGMLGHNAAEDCRPAHEGWTWAPPDSWAQNRCRRLFVITDVRAR